MPVEPADLGDPFHEAAYLSPADERANVLTHGAAIVLSLFVAAHFWATTSQQEPGLRLSCLAFSLALTVVYTFSTLSHAIQTPTARFRLRAWDQGTIYFLIVGTYSPFIWQATEGLFRILMLLATWGLAGAGFYSKVFATHRVNSVATVTYLALGWLPALPLIPKTPTICFVWMVAGGVCYSVGVIFLKLSARVRYSHAAWHLMVILGSACHWYAIQLLLTFV